MIYALDASIDTRNDFLVESANNDSTYVIKLLLMLTKYGAKITRAATQLDVVLKKMPEKFTTTFNKIYAGKVKYYKNLFAIYAKMPSKETSGIDFDHVSSVIPHHSKIESFMMCVQVYPDALSGISEAALLKKLVPNIKKYYVAEYKVCIQSYTEFISELDRVVAKIEQSTGSVANIKDDTDFISHSLKLQFRLVEVKVKSGQILTESDHIILSESMKSLISKVMSFPKEIFVTVSKIVAKVAWRFVVRISAIAKRVLSPFVAIANRIHTFWAEVIPSKITDLLSRVFKIENPIVGMAIGYFAKIGVGMAGMKVLAAGLGIFGLQACFVHVALNAVSHIKSAHSAAGFVTSANGMVDGIMQSFGSIKDLL